MAAFIVETVRITDRAAFMRYVEQLGNLSAQFGGEQIVRGAATAILDGEAEPGERVVACAFPMLTRYAPISALQPTRPPARPASARMKQASVW